MRSRKTFDQLKDEMEELFAELCQVPRITGQRAGFRPAVDVYRTDDPPALTVVAELAGIDPQDIELSVADGALTLVGRRRRQLAETRVYQHMEIDYGVFERRIPLSAPVDFDQVEATYEQGLLTIVFPISERPSGRFTVQIVAGRSG